MPAVSIYAQPIVVLPSMIVVVPLPMMCSCFGEDVQDEVTKQVSSEWANALSRPYLKIQIFDSQRSFSYNTDRQTGHGGAVHTKLADVP